MDKFPVNKLPLNVLTHIASFLLPSKFKFLTIRNLGDYLDYSDLLPFREASAEFKKVADDLLLYLVNQIITQLGIFLDLKKGHLPTEGYPSALKFLHDIKVLNKLFNELNFCIIYSIEIDSSSGIGLLRTIQEFTFPKQNVVSPYIFHLLCQAFPLVAAKLCKWEGSWGQMGILDELKEQVYRYAFVSRLDESIFQPAINNNQSALFALHYYKLLHPDYPNINYDTETAIDLIFKNNGYANKLDREIFKAWSLNFNKSKHLTNEQLLIYKKRIIDKLTKDKVDTSNIVEKLLHRLLSNALLTEEFNQTIDVCLLAPSFKKIDISNFGTKYHMDLAKLLTKTLPNIDDTFLINKIKRVLIAIWFSEEMFEVAFNDINIKPGRVALLDKYLNPSIYDAIDDLIVKDEGNYCLELIGPWIKLYTEWSEEHINIFAQLWNKYFANKLSMFMTDSNQFYNELYKLYKIIMSLFKLTLFKNITINIDTENLQRIINLLTLDHITRIAKSLNEHLFTLINLNPAAIDKLSNFIQYKAYLQSSNDFDQDHEDIEVDKIIFVINFHHLIQNKSSDKTTTLLTNSAIDDMFPEIREIVLDNYETFIKWPSDLLILFCNLDSNEYDKLQRDIITDINFADIIAKNKTEYSILLEILKTSAAKMGVEIIREFGFEFADKINKCQMKSGSLLDHLAKQPKTEWDDMFKIIANNNKDISKILNAFSKRKAPNDDEIEKKRRKKVEGKRAVRSPQSSSIAGPSSLHSSNVNILFNQKPVVNKESESSSNDNKFNTQLRKS